jgi:hypothetical protein
MPTVLVIFWNRHKKFKQNQKNTKSSRCVMLCNLVANKSNRLGILQTFWKIIHKKELSCMKFHWFQAIWARYGHNQGIVCSNDLILYTCVYLWMSNNVDLRSFNICWRKFNFHFLNTKKWVFCEAPTKNMLQKCTTTNLNDTTPYFMHNSIVF